MFLPAHGTRIANPNSYYLMKRLLLLSVNRPFTLDLFIALVLLPVFCHLVVTAYDNRGLGALLSIPGYRKAMAFSYLCGLAVMAYTRFSNHRLNTNYGIDDDWSQRATDQLRWNVLPPLLFVVLAITAYYSYFGLNIIKRGYFSREVFFVLGGIGLLVLLYYTQNKHRYFWSKQQEREEHDRLATEREAAEGAAAFIQVVKPVRPRQAIRLPLADVAVIDRHGGETYVSTWDGGLYKWPMPSEAMKAFSKVHGFTWFGQHYGLRRDSVSDYVGIGEQGGKVLLYSGINVLATKHVQRVPVEDREGTYLLFHKNIAREVREWCEQEGRPDMERPGG